MTARPRSPRPRSRRWIVAAAGLAIVAPGAVARADEPEAMRLFDKGRKLMERASTLDEGCRTLEASLKLWDRGDTVLNLALCHRRQGRTATAWAEFGKAINHGTKVHFPEAIEEAKRQRAQLEAILSTVTVTVPPQTAAIDGLVVELDGAPFPPGRYNVPFVRDPGPVHVTARAAGYEPFDAQVQLGAVKDKKDVVVALKPEAKPPPPPPPPPAPPPARPRWPWIVGGVGAALGVAAIGSEIVSRLAHDELDDKCGAARTACPVGYDYGPARRREIVGFGLFAGLGAGGILAIGAAGVGLGLSARTSGETSAPKTSLVLSPTWIGVHSTF